MSEVEGFLIEFVLSGLLERALEWIAEELDVVGGVVAFLWRGEGASRLPLLAMKAAIRAKRAAASRGNAAD